MTRNVTTPGKLQKFICFSSFISPVSLRKTWSLLHPRTEVPEDRYGVGVALGQWHRAVLSQWAALVASLCRKDQLQGQQANPTRFSLPLWIKGLGWKEKTPAGGGGGVMLCWAHAQHLAPLLGHQCPAGRSRGCLLLPHFPQFSNASCQKHAKVLCAPYLLQRRGKQFILVLPRFRYLLPACLAGCLQAWSQRDSSLQGIVASFCEWQEMLQDNGNKSIVRALDEKAGEAPHCSWVPKTSPWITQSHLRTRNRGQRLFWSVKLTDSSPHVWGKLSRLPRIKNRTQGPEPPAICRRHHSADAGDLEENT